MNIGNVPGYYYDEEKKKYFKIQANHQVPKDAKYSKSNVQHDKRESKKRKLEDRRRQHAGTQTVTRSGILLDPLASGVALHREHGQRKVARSLVDRDAAIMRHLKPSRKSVVFSDERQWTGQLAKMTHCPESQQTVMSLRSISPTGRGSSTYTLHTLSSRLLQPNDPTPTRLSVQHLPGPYAAFGSPLTSISTIEVNSGIIVFASAQDRLSPGNVFSSRLIPHASVCQFAGSLTMVTSNFATLGTHASTSLWKTSVNPILHDTVAVAGTLGVWSLDLECTPKDRLSITRRDYAEPEDDETFAVDWLDPNTIAAGSEQIYLWDQRSGGASQRFSCKARVTGIANPDRGPANPQSAGGQTLLVSTNRTISLFDVRYVTKSRPLFCWRHEHQGPQIDMTSNGRGLFATVDRDSYVHVFSTRTGGEIARLPKAKGSDSGMGMVRSLQWDGEVALRGLVFSDVVGWGWEGRDD